MAPDDHRSIENREHPTNVDLSERSDLGHSVSAADEAHYRYPLRRKPVRLTDPTKPVAQGEWEAEYAAG